MSAWEQDMEKWVKHSKNLFETLDKRIMKLEAKIRELNEKLGKTELVEEIYNKVIDGSLFGQIPVIKEMKDEMFLYKMNLKKNNKKSNTKKMILNTVKTLKKLYPKTKEVNP